MSQTAAPPKQILIIRLSAIGDIVFATPLIAALQRRYPDARISWLVQPESASLLAGNTSLAEVIVWPRRRWRELWRSRQLPELLRQIGRFRRELRQRGFDLVVDAQGLLKSGLLAWLTGARERIGLDSREGSRYLMTRVIDRGGDNRRIGSEYLHLAERLGLPTDRFDMHIALGQEDERFARALKAGYGLDAGYAVVCPFTTRPQKHWFDPQWIALLPRLVGTFSLPVVILGGAGDRARADRIAAAAGDSVVSLAGETSISQAAAVISQAALLIGVDTGLTHMGIAFNRPSVALFGSTCPYLDTTRKNAVVLYHPLPCSPCRRKPTCNGEFTCMAAIGVDEVLRAGAVAVSLNDA